MDIAAEYGGSSTRSRPWRRQLNVQVLGAILPGGLIGPVLPAFGESLDRLGDSFSRPVRRGIAGMGLILGIDRLMQQCRALTNVTDNAEGALMAARRDGARREARAAALGPTAGPENDLVLARNGSRATDNKQTPWGGTP